MKRIVISIIVVGGVLAGILAGLVYLLDRPEIDLTIDPQPEIENPHTEQVDESPQDEMPQLSIPDDLYDELDVSDIEVRVESIAATPTIWRAFLDANIASDPTWEFGCFQFLDTGGNLILDVFSDEAGNTWVVEAHQEFLVGIGKLTPERFYTISEYHRSNEEIACVELTDRQYESYTLIAAGVELNKEFNQVRLLVEDIPLPYPPGLYDSIVDAKDAILLGNNLLYLGYDGIEVFDLQWWEVSIVYDFLWNDVWGISDFVQPEDNTNIAAIAVQLWDQEQASVIVYGASEAEGYYEFGRSEALLAWQLGVSGVAGLEWSEDLQFIDASTLQITEYPQFDQQIVNDLYPPDPGPSKVSTWGIK